MTEARVFVEVKYKKKYFKWSVDREYIADMEAEKVKSLILRAVYHVKREEEDKEEFNEYSEKRNKV